MYKTFKIQIKKIICTVMILMLLFAAIPLTAYAAPNPLSITVNQIFTTSTSAVNGTFTYRLKALDTKNPMPLGSTSEGYIFTINKTNSVDIDSIYFSKAGKYIYELSQVITKAKSGYGYDTNVYTLEVYVDADLDVILIILNKDGKKVEEITFENQYSFDLIVDPLVRKIVKGNPPSPGVFTFKLTAHDIDNPMPEGSANGVKTIQVTGEGEGDFMDIHYDRLGVFSYSIFEVDTGITGYTYDTTVYTLTDTIAEDENGILTVVRKITDSNNNEINEMVFINTYTESGGGTHEGGGKDGGEGKESPITGDEMRAQLYKNLLIGGSIIAVSAIVYLIVGGKRRKSAKK